MRVSLTNATREPTSAAPTAQVAPFASDQKEKQPDEGALLQARTLFKSTTELASEALKGGKFTMDPNTGPSIGRSDDLLSSIRGSSSAEDLSTLKSPTRPWSPPGGQKDLGDLYPVPSLKGKEQMDTVASKVIRKLERSARLTIDRHSSPLPASPPRSISPVPPAGQWSGGAQAKVPASLTRLSPGRTSPSIDANFGKLVTESDLGSSSAKSEIELSSLRGEHPSSSEHGDFSMKSSALSFIGGNQRRKDGYLRLHRAESKKQMQGVDALTQAMADAKAMPQLTEKFKSNLQLSTQRTSSSTSTSAARPPRPAPASQSSGNTHFKPPLPSWGGKGHLAPSADAIASSSSPYIRKDSFSSDSSSTNLLGPAPEYSVPKPSTKESAPLKYAKGELKHQRRIEANKALVLKDQEKLAADKARRAKEAEEIRIAKEKEVAAKQAVKDRERLLKKVARRPDDAPIPAEHNFSNEELETIHRLRGKYKLFLRLKEQYPTMKKSQLIEIVERLDGPLV